MKVISPDTSTDVRHFGAVVDSSKKKKTEAAIMAMVPMKKVKAT
jgi:hypothetical protein